MSRDNEQKGKESRKMSRENEQKDACVSNEMQLQNQSLAFFPFTKVTFSYQHSIWFTHGLQHYCFLGQDNLRRLCGFWQEFRQIWTTFLDQR